MLALLLGWAFAAGVVLAGVAAVADTDAVRVELAAAAGERWEYRPSSSATTSTVGRAAAAGAALATGRVGAGFWVGAGVGGLVEPLAGKVFDSRSSTDSYGEWPLAFTTGKPGVAGVAGTGSAVGAGGDDTFPNNS